jgi:hypothetical protein
MIMKVTPTRLYLNDENSRTAAIDHIARILGQGHTLAMFLLESINVRLGTIFVLAPGALDSAQVVQFDQGHFPQGAVTKVVLGELQSVSPIADSESQLVEVISNKLVRGNACLLENAMARSGDTWLEKTESRVITHGTEIYHVLLETDRDEEKIRNAIREARQFPVFIGATGQLLRDTASSLVTAGVVRTDDLKVFAESTQTVVVGAYDGEGYIVWDRNPA